MTIDIKKEREHLEELLTLIDQMRWATGTSVIEEDERQKTLNDLEFQYKKKVHEHCIQLMNTGNARSIGFLDNKN